MASAVTAEGVHRAHRTRVPERTIRIWPIFALLPITIVGEVKASGFVAIGGADTTVISVALVLAATFITVLRHPRYPVQRMLPFFIFALIVLVGVAMSDAGEYQALKARDFFLLTSVVVCCIPVLLRDVRDLRGMLVMWFTGGTIIASLVLILGGAEELYGRAGIGEATLGPAYLSAAAFVVGGTALGERLLPMAIAVPGLAVSGISLVSIGSRGPMVAAACGLVGWMLLRGVFRARTLIVVVLAGTAAYLGSQLASDAALNRLFLEDTAREELWAMAQTAFVEHPLLGLGFGDYSTLFVGLTYPHNLFMETAAELGIIGLLCLTALLALAIRGIVRTRSDPESRVLAALAIVMVSGQLFSSDLTNRLFWIAVIPCLLLPIAKDAAGAKARVAGRVGHPPGMPASAPGTHEMRS